MKTNVFYNASMVDDGSILYDEDVFTAEDLSNLKYKDLTYMYGVWGNAYKNPTFISKSDDSTPTNSTLTISSDVGRTNLEVNSNFSLFGVNTSYGVDLGSVNYVNALRFIGYGVVEFTTKTIKSQSANPSARFKLFHSNDNVTWTEHTLWDFGSVTITKGEILFTFTGVSARYFKMHTGVAPYIEFDNDANFRYGIHFTKVFAINTAAGHIFKAKIDLGNNYPNSKLYIHNYLRNDISSLGISSSTDDISYTSNSLTQEFDWVSLESLPVYGKLLYNEVTGKLYAATSNGIYGYDFVNDEWSVVINDASYLTYCSSLAGIDTKRNIIYTCNSNKAAAYFIEYNRYTVLPDLHTVPGAHSGAVFIYDKFFVSLNDVAVNTTYGTRLGKIFISYDWFSKKWRIVDIRYSPMMKDRYIQPERLLYNDVEYMVIPIGNIGYFFDFLSTFLYPNSGLDSFRGIVYPDIFPSSDESKAGRPQFVWDSDRNRSYFSMAQTGFNFFTNRKIDWYIDHNETELHCFPSNNNNGTGEFYNFSGLNISGKNSMVYVPDQKKIYRTGSFELTGLDTDFKYYDTECFMSLKAPLISNTRYIKIQNLSTTRWPIIFSQIEVIEENNTIKYGQESNFLIRQNIEYLVGLAGEPEEIQIYNDSTSSISGIAYIEPDGSDGSRCFQICESESGTYKSHCIYNDLSSFVCTANSELYNTPRCGIACTSGTAGLAAVGFYTRDQINVDPVVSSGNGSIYVRSLLPEDFNIEDRPFDIITELN